MLHFFSDSSGAVKEEIIHNAASKPSINPSVRTLAVNKTITMQATQVSDFPSPAAVLVFPAAQQVCSPAAVYFC